MRVEQCTLLQYNWWCGILDVSEEFKFCNCPCRWQLRFEAAIAFCSFAAQKSHSGGTSSPSHGLEVDGNGIFSISYGSYWPVLLFDALSIRVGRLFSQHHKGIELLFMKDARPLRDFLLQIRIQEVESWNAVSRSFDFAILFVFIIKIYRG